MFVLDPERHDTSDKASRELIALRTYASVMPDPVRDVVSAALPSAVLIPPPARRLKTQRRLGSPGIRDVGALMLARAGITSSGVCGHPGLGADMVNV